MIFDLYPLSKSVGDSEKSRDFKILRDLATALYAQKPGKSRLRRAVVHASKDEEAIEIEDATCAALSGSLSSSSLRYPAPDLNIQPDLLSPQLSWILSVCDNQHNLIWRGFQ